MSPRTASQEFDRGVRAAITWLHARALQMNDPHARAILNSAAFDLGGSERINFSSAKQVEGESSRDDPLPPTKGIPQ